MTIDFATLADLASLSVVAYGEATNYVGAASFPSNWRYLPFDDSFILPESGFGFQFEIDSQGFFSYNNYLALPGVAASIEAFVAYNVETAQIAIIFRGTDEAYDVLTWPTASAGMDDLVIAVSSLVNWAHGKAELANFSLYAAGHSLGGALAERVVDLNPSIFSGGLGFGSPGFSLLPGGTNSNFVHITHTEDVVGTLFPYSHIGPTIKIQEMDSSGVLEEHNKYSYEENILFLSNSLAFKDFNIYGLSLDYDLSYNILAASKQVAFSGLLPQFYQGFTGSLGADFIDARAHTTRVRIDGFGGNDTIHGGSGDDFLSGGSGENTIYGEGGADHIFGGGLDDDLRGQDGDDTIDAGNGNNTIYGGIGQDTITAGTGYDFIRGEEGNDIIYGGGGGGTIYGDGGNDTIRGGLNQDILRGGTGADTFVYQLNDLGVVGDRILDYNQGNTGSYSSTEGDVIDLRGAVTAAGKLQAEADLLSFVARSDGSGMDLYLDPDGTGTAYSAVNVAFVANVTAGSNVTVLTGANGETPSSIPVVSAPGSYTITPTSRTVDEGIGTITFTITRPVTTSAETVYVSTTFNRGSANNNDYTGLPNVPVTFAAGDATETVTITINNDSSRETAEQFGLIVQSSPDQPASRYLASASFTIIDNDDSGTGSSFTTGNDTVWLAPPPYAGQYVDGLAGNDTAVLDFRSLATGFTISRFEGTVNANTGGANPLSIVNVENFVVLGSNEYDSIDLGQGGVVIARGGNDNIWGGSGVDVIDAGSGDDYIYNIGVGDFVEGGSGIDRLDFNVYNDIGDTPQDFVINLDTGQGAGGTWTGIERVSGVLGFGNDTVVSRMQIDYLSGGGGTNTLFADYSGALPDGRTAESTNLYVYYGEPRLSVRLSDNSQIDVDLVKFQNLTIAGSNGNDYFDAGTGSRHFIGLDGNDYLNGGAQADILDGGDGDDFFGGIGIGDTVIGGAGTDHANLGLSEATAGLTVNTITGVGSGGPSWTGVERVSGSLGSGNDAVVTGFQVDYLHGGGGTNSLTADYSGALPDGRTALWTNFYVYYGEPRLSVRLSDNSQIDVDLVQFQNLTITGSNGNDSFDAGTGSRHFIGMGGNDNLYGGAQADILDGGEGDDYFGSVGIGDTVIGGAGIDTVNLDLTSSTGGLTVNTLTGVGSGGPSWTGVERVTGSLGSGNDTVVTGFQLDYLQGGGGTNSLTADYSGALPDGRTALWTNLYVYYGEPRLAVRLSDNSLIEFDLAQFQNLTITGSNGNDNFDAGTGSRHFIGLGGNDNLYGGAQADILDGGEGDDYFGNVGIGDTVIGGAGIDTVNFDLTSSTAGLTVNTLTGVGSGGPSWTGVERVTGSLGSGNDTVVAGFHIDYLYGGGGTNSLTADYSGALPDGRTALWTNLYVYYGEPRLAVRLSDNSLIEFDLAQFQNLTITGSNGNDNFDAGTGSRHFIGMGGNDNLYGGAQADILDGGDGDDYFSAAGGNDTVDGGAGVDIVSFSGSLADYTLTYLGSRTWRITDNRAGSPDGEDTVSNVESLHFADQIHFPALNLVGTANADVLVGDAGADTITGEAGDDGIDAGPGNDTITGGGGNDTVAGGDGDDTIRVGLGSGIDSVSGGAGHDRIVATAANTVIGLSQISGIEEIDAAGLPGVRVVGNSAAQVLDFSNVTLSGVVSISGEGGNDVITGSIGNDTIIGSFGNDTMDGGEGDDTFQIGLSVGFDTVVGGAGHDRIVATASNAAIGLTQFSGIEEISSGGFAGVSILGTAASQMLDFSTVTLTGIIAIDAGNGNDTVIGSAGDDNILGSFGNDTLDGRAGRNTLTGGTGNDVYVVRSINDKVVEAIDGGTDRIDVHMNAYSIASLSQIENLTFAGVGNATLTGNALANAISGGIGDDILNGGSGNDTVSGLAGNDTITGSFGSDVLEGGEGDDTFLIGVSAGFDTINGGIGNDRIQATADNATISLTGFSGIEEISSGGFSGVRIVTSAASQVLDFSAMTLVGIASIDAGSGNDTVTGSAGSDTIIGGFGNDILDGGAGDDTFLFGANAGTDKVNGGSGYDRIVAGANNATISLSALTQLEAIDAGGFSGVRIVGNAGAETMDFSTISLTGIAAIDGGRGNDTIIGSAGNDILIGGGGKDVLTGGAGADTFVIQSATDSSPTSSDTVADFLAGSDRIDLSAIDADGTFGSSNAFAWLDTGAFTGAAGQLRYEKLAATTVVYGDTNGDGAADFQLTLMGQIDLGAADFVL